MQKEYTTDERVAITQRIGEQMNECRTAHWRILSAEGGPTVYDCERHNMNYITVRMAAYIARVNAHLSGINIYNLSDKIEQIKAATRMARVWYQMTPYAMMDETLGKNLMDDLAELFENYQVERCYYGNITASLNYTITTHARMFIPGTCELQHDQRLDRFTAYEVNRIDMQKIFASAVAHISWNVDGIAINTSENDAQ